MISMNSKLLPFLLLFLLASSGDVSAQGRMIKYRNPRVSLWTDIGKAEAQKVMDEIAFFEDFIDRFFRGYGISCKKSNPIRCYLYSEHQAFMDMRRKEDVYQNATAYYSPSNNRIVASYQDGSKKAMSTLMHEVGHQIIRRYFNNPPPWFDEGLACYFQAMEFDPHRNLVTDCNEQSRLKALRNLLENGGLEGWKTFFDDERFNFSDRLRRGVLHEGNYYAQAWGVIFFYINSGDEELDKFFARFLKGMNTGRERSKMILNDLTEREGDFRTFFDQDHQKTYTLYTRAVKLRARKAYEEALKPLLEILSESPRHVAALRLAGEVTWEGRKYAPSLTFWRIMADLDDEDAYFQSKICRCLTEMGSLDKDPEMLQEAISMGKKAVRTTRSQDADCIAALAMAYHASGEFQEALRTMRKATRFSRNPRYEVYKGLEEQYSKDYMEYNRNKNRADKK